METTACPIEPPSAPLTPRLREPLFLGGVPMPSRFFLAPLAGYTTLAFRLAVRALGGLGLATTDLVNARALLLTSRRTMELIKTCLEDRPLAIQIYGSHAEEMREAAQWLENYGVTVIDINMGCPVHKVCRGGGGSAMMGDPAKTVELVRKVVEAVRIPVTVKMRLGWDDDNWSAPFFAREFEQAGVAAVTIHGRTRAQGFGGTVNLQGIRAVVEAVEAIPVIGNGDVRTIAEAEQMLQVTGCAGVAIGRGALLNPWIFTQLACWKEIGEAGVSPTWEQRVAFMDRHLHLLAEHRSEKFGCLCFRKLANWYCRAIHPGHEIQQRLMRLENVAEFEQIIREIRENGPPRNYGKQSPQVPVPSGPNAHW